MNATSRLVFFYILVAWTAISPGLVAVLWVELRDARRRLRAERRVVIHDVRLSPLPWSRGRGVRS